MNEQIFAFFSLPKGLPDLESKEMETALWSRYLGTGGTSTDVPAFVPGLACEDGFICRISKQELMSKIMNRNPVPTCRIN